MQPVPPHPDIAPVDSAMDVRRQWWQGPAARLFLVLVLIAVVLACLHVWFWTLIIRTVPDPALSPYVGWWLAFDVGGEANLPTWFGVVLWLFAAAVVALYSLVAQQRWTWRLLALACVLLSADEAAMLHENLHHLGLAMGVDRWAPTLPYTWVVPGVLVALLLAAVFCRAVFRLPRAQRILVLLSGVLFVGGAIGVELLGGLAMGDGAYLAYTVLTGIEEALEMMAIALFACTLLSLLDVSREEAGTIRLTAKAKPATGQHVEPVQTADDPAALDDLDLDRAPDPVQLADRRSA